MPQSLSLGPRAACNHRDDAMTPCCLTLHFLQFAHIGVKEGVDALRLSVPINVQLDVRREAAARQQDKNRKDNDVNGDIPVFKAP